VAAFVSPLADPGSWTYTTVDGVLIPDGLRYAGYAVRGVRATRASDQNVQLPATGVLRKVVEPSGQACVEVQVLPFPVRRVAHAIQGGLPTFYLVFDDPTGLTFQDGEADLGGVALRAAQAVTILAVRQDRMLIDPALFAAQLSTAITQTGGDASRWQPFADALANATASGDSAPVLLYDHAGQPRTGGNVEIVLGSPGAETVHLATLAPQDGGDLQRTVARMHAADPIQMPIPNLWGGGRTSFRLRPLGGPGEVQLVRLEDNLVTDMEVTLTPALRSVTFTNLNGWFAPQFVNLGTGNENNLARFSRGNRITPFHLGQPFIDDFFSKLQDAQRADGGLHLGTGFMLFPQTKFTHRQIGDDRSAILTLADATAQLGQDDTLPLTLEQAAQMIGANGGATRFLSAKFYQFEDPREATVAELVVASLVVTGILGLDSIGVEFARTDFVGVIMLFLIAIGASAYTQHVLNANGDPIESNKPAVDLLSQITNAVSVFDPYRVRVEDNIPPPQLTDFPFNDIFKVTRHFGLYHQKLSIVKVGADHFGYCGGMDLNPNRLDDLDHLAREPYHDVHARIEGNAVHDLALTFEQRWALSGGGAATAFPVPLVNPTLAPGTDIAQIARTYFAPAPGADDRALFFAPHGDRTIADTTLSAIRQAQEYIYLEDQYFVPPRVYREALLAKVSNREIRQLIISIVGISGDILFGDRVREAFFHDLLEADAGARIVRIGYPRRRFTSTDNSVRASSGKMLLAEDLFAGGGTQARIVLTPDSRIPALPFWVAVEGELIYVYDEGSATNVPGTKAFLCERGDTTQIVQGGATPKGAFPRGHKVGAPVTAIDLTGIYVHAKLILVDDVFVGIGSANLDNRGFFYDGEANCFTIPEGLRTSPNNPAFQLRRKIWAEMVDLPEQMIAPLMSDPLAAGRLFDRSPFACNRYTPIEARPPHLMLSYTSGDGAFLDLLRAFFFTVQFADIPTLYATVVDPHSSLEPNPEP
jgi:phosphatidylserine/phosphatidylglycerophosphate/cardiolipin synthase-like enzyme